MSKATQIPDVDCAWEDGTLGQDENYVAVAEPNEAAVNSSLGLQPISIRLEKSLIEDFKLIAEFHGLSYQPLMRQALRRFAEGEKRRLLRESLCQTKQDAKAKHSEPVEPKPRKVA